MTRQQSACLAFIKRYITTHGHSPSYQQIGAHLGLASKSGVSRLVDALIRHGHLAKLSHCARSLQVIETSGSLSSDLRRLIDTYGLVAVAREYNRLKVEITNPNERAA